ncbi:hypothetical protein Hanom_Chr10g00905051 [Helianthus anomalus]
MGVCFDNNFLWFFFYLILLHHNAHIPTTPILEKRPIADWVFTWRTTPKDGALFTQRLRMV